MLHRSSELASVKANVPLKLYRGLYIYDPAPREAIKQPKIDALTRSLAFIRIHFHRSLVV
jgi:hypothetical protein